MFSCSYCGTNVVFNTLDLISSHKKRKKILQHVNVSFTASMITFTVYQYIQLFPPPSASRLTAHIYTQ